MSDDLTNLSWLTTFNLSAKSMSLSPPCSPPLSPHNNNNLTVSSLDDDEDEADNHGRQPLGHSSSPLIAQLNFPYYRGVPSGSWKNSIRHNLACNPSFAKVDKNLLAVSSFPAGSETSPSLYPCVFLSDARLLWQGQFVVCEQPRASEAR